MVLPMAALAWCAADAAGVFPEGEITDVVVHFYDPVAAQVRQQVSRAGLIPGQAGDAEDGDGAEEGPVRAVAGGRRPTIPGRCSSASTPQQHR